IEAGTGHWRLETGAAAVPASRPSPCRTHAPMSGSARMLQPLLTHLEKWLFEPPDSLIGRPLWKIARILRYPYALVRDIVRGHLTLRAMSLVYTTLLSIVPLLALSFSVLKGLGYHEDLEPVLFSFLEPLGTE